MKKVILLAGVAALAACGGNDADRDDEIATIDDDGIEMDDGAMTTAQASAPGTYQIVQDGQVVGTTTINADGTYQESYPDGSTMSGMHSRNAQGQICFDPDGPEEATCWAEGPVEADGSYTVTGDNGETSTIRPVTT